MTRAEEHALRLTMRLAMVGEQLSVADLSRLERLPQPTVAKVLGRLRRGGVVVAARGRSGGYELSRPPREVSVAAVVKALESRVMPTPFCSESSEGDCVHAASCGLKKVWSGLNGLIHEFLAQVSLEDLVSEDGPALGQARVNLAFGRVERGE